MIQLRGIGVVVMARLFEALCPVSPHDDFHTIDSTTAKPIGPPSRRAKSGLQGPLNRVFVQDMALFVTSIDPVAQLATREKPYYRV